MASRTGLVVVAAVVVGVAASSAIAVSSDQPARVAIAPGRADLDPPLYVVPGTQLRTVEPLSRCAGDGYVAVLDVTRSADEVLDDFEGQLRRQRFEEPVRTRHADGIHVNAGNVGDVQVDLSLGGVLTIEACSQT
jgi:hypothetical protein